MSRGALPTVTLAQFLATARAQIDAFEAQWRKAMAGTPEHFPNHLPEGDWFEQLHMFDPGSSLLQDVIDHPDHRG